MAYCRKPIIFHCA